MIMKISKTYLLFTILLSGMPLSLMAHKWVDSWLVSLVAAEGTDADTETKYHIRVHKTSENKFVFSGHSIDQRGNEKQLNPDEAHKIYKEISEAVG